MKAEGSSLFLRLVAAISAVLLGGAALLAYAASNYAGRAAQDAYDRLLVGAAEQIRETLRVEDGAVTSDIPVSAFVALSLSRRERIFYRVVGPGGETLTGYGDLPVSREPSGETKSGQDVWDAEYRKTPVRIAALRQFVAGAPAPGFATVVVAHTMESRAELARGLTLRALLLLGIMSVIALGGVAAAVRFALIPLHRIEAALAARQPNDLTPLHVEAPPEIAGLVQAINRFIARLADRMDDLRRLIDDAAHQIRTPVTALSAQVDLLQSETSPERRQKQVERIAARTAQIGRLVNQLLSQTMVSHRARSATAEPFDLRDVLRQAAADAVPAAMDRDIAVSFDLPMMPVDLVGDPVAIREALRNIIDNAVQHGARTRLTIAARSGGGRVIAEIADDGPGIREEHWPLVTRRFWRAGGDGEGFGLGLAIAADVAKTHAAELNFAHPANGDFAVQMIFGTPSRGAPATGSVPSGSVTR
jgi:two-component system, OmpR family, sensor histidine kinase TctE